MGVMEQLNIGSLFKDVQRMDKRQVSWKAKTFPRRWHFVWIDVSVISFYLQHLYQFLSFGMIVSSALMIWKGLMVVTGSESPIVVVLSGSMEPAFHRGDLLFLTNFREEPVRVGDIVVFKVEGRDIPIVHRVIKLHEKYEQIFNPSKLLHWLIELIFFLHSIRRENGTVKFLTKGDNNSVDDRGLYAPGQLWLTKNDIVGRARGVLPYVGMITIYMNEYPNFKVCMMSTMVFLATLMVIAMQSNKWYLLKFYLFQYAILGILALYVLLHRE